ALSKIGGEQAVAALAYSWSTADIDFRTTNWRDIAGSIWAKTERSVQKLVAALQDRDISLSVVEALGELADEEALIPLVEALASAQPAVVFRAALGLGKFA